jgi:FkbM family methyltransferase
MWKRSIEKYGEAVIKTKRIIEDFIKNKTDAYYEMNYCDTYKIAVFLDYLKPGMTVIDAGAYIGQFTILFNRIVYPSGRVIAFEPEEKNFESLVKSVNKDDNCVTCVNSALSNYHGRGGLCTTFGEMYPRGHFMIEDDNYARNIDVTYIDKYCKDNNIQKVDLLKVDVEGQDLKVLQGAENIIDSNKDIIIPIEIHQGNDLSVFEAAPAKRGLSYDLLDEKRGYIIHKNRFLPDKKEIYDFFKSKGFKLYDLHDELKDITNEPVETKIQKMTEIIAKR